MTQTANKQQSDEPPARKGWSFGVVSKLIKLPISTASTLTTAAGYVLVGAPFGPEFIFVLLGILMMAAASAGLNQVAEAKMDARVPRTATRPIPSGRITRRGALLFCLTLMTAGFLCLLLGVSLVVALLGTSAAVLYNLVYTPLKRLTPFAVIPGAFIGAVPPLAGWAAAGGSLWDPEIHQVAFFLWVWQTPHFWLLLLFEQDNYRSSGLPSLFDHFNEGQVARITLAWIAATAISGVCSPLFAPFHSSWSAYLIAVLAVLLMARALVLLRVSARAERSQEEKRRAFRSYRMRFMEINLYALLVLFTMVMDNQLQQ